MDVCVDLKCLSFRHHGCWTEASDLVAVAAVLLSNDHKQRGKIHQEGEERETSGVSIVSKHTLLSSLLSAQASLFVLTLLHHIIQELPRSMCTMTLKLHPPDIPIFTTSFINYTTNVFPLLQYLMFK